MTMGELRQYGLEIVQPKTGYRFSVDALLLADFCKVGENERVVDLGTGCGIIPLVLARKQPLTWLCGVEFQQEMAELAMQNVVLNGLGERVSIIESDVLALPGRLPPSSFDLVTANPPYRIAGTGLVSPRAGRDLARHETTAGLADFLAAAKRLARTGGRICMIYHVCRLTELLLQASLLKLAPVRLQMVHGSPGAEAKMFLVELLKGRKGDLTVLPPCFTRQGSVTIPSGAC